MNHLIVNLYDSLVFLLTPIFHLISKLVLNDQLSGRSISSAKIEEIKNQRTRYRKAILFFCSSAGEFEQAKPLIERLEQSQKFYIHVFFQSKSGTNFAKARNETLNYDLAPLDSHRTWRRIISAIQPEYCVVVRHELWPGFLTAARELSNLVLIDLSAPPRGELSFVKKTLLSLFHTIFLVDKKDQQFFAPYLTGPELRISGDTKFDRAIERARNGRQEAENLKTRLEEKIDFSHTLIIGSAWMPELSLSLKSFQKYRNELTDWLLIVAPHDVSPSNIAKMKDEIARSELEATLFSELDSASRNTKVLIVDVMGRLAEFYGLCDLGIVGGAMHDKGIHNVLEPAAYGLPVAFGPKYHGQREAVQLVDNSFAKVVESEADLGTWWVDMINRRQQLSQKIVDDLVSRTGAAATIATYLTSPRV